MGKAFAQECATAGLKVGKSRKRGAIALRLVQPNWSTSCRDVDVDVVQNHPKSEWGEYFAEIKRECPWSYAAWLRGQIDITEWTGEIKPLGDMQARVYTISASDEDVEKLAQELDQGEYEWLFSYPGYGPFATPEAVLIQQDRSVLAELRGKQNG